MRFETFAPLQQLDFITHAFTLRDEEDTRTDSYQDDLLKTLGFQPQHHASAEQTHGTGVGIAARPSPRIASVDAIATKIPNLPLLIRCADCAAVYIVDRATPAIGLVHSGKKGTQGNIVGATISQMVDRLGTDPANCLAVVSPSIGPCHYEMDIWAGIESQLREAGIADIHNPRVCTACRLDRYFSYRAEKGKTGRMLAALALIPK